MCKVIIYSVLITLLIILEMIAGSCRKDSRPNQTRKGQNVNAISEQENIIVIEADGKNLHFIEKKRWAANEFQNMVKEKSASYFIKKFNGIYHVNASNFDVKFNEEEKMTILECNISVKFRGWYDFSWFLKPLGLDFLNNGFKRKEKELLWQGNLNGIRTTILLKFKFRINNCHAHVWPVK